MAAQSCLETPLNLLMLAFPATHLVKELCLLRETVCGIYLHRSLAHSKDSPTLNNPITGYSVLPENTSSRKTFSHESMQGALCYSSFGNHFGKLYSFFFPPRITEGWQPESFLEKSLYFFPIRLCPKIFG